MGWIWSGTALGKCDYCSSCPNLRMKLMPQCQTAVIADTVVPIRPMQWWSLIFTAVYLKASFLIILIEGSKQSNGASSIFSCFLSVLAQRDEEGISAKSWLKYKNKICIYHIWKQPRKTDLMVWALGKLRREKLKQLVAITTKIMVLNRTVPNKDRSQLLMCPFVCSFVFWVL